MQDCVVYRTMTQSLPAQEPAACADAANDDIIRPWDEDGFDSGEMPGMTAEFRERLDVARRMVEAQAGARTAGWSSAQILTALGVINAGHAAHGAAAIANGDAVLEQGEINYDPGCSWIDSVLFGARHSIEECEDILAQWEARPADRHGGQNRRA